MKYYQIEDLDGHTWNGISFSCDTKIKYYSSVMVWEELKQLLKIRPEKGIHICQK